MELGGSVEPGAVGEGVAGLGEDERILKLSGICIENTGRKLPCSCELSAAKAMR